MENNTEMPSVADADRICDVRYSEIKRICEFQLEWSCDEESSSDQLPKKQWVTFDDILAVRPLLFYQFEVDQYNAWCLKRTTKRKRCTRSQQNVQDDPEDETGKAPMEIGAKGRPEPYMSWEYMMTNKDRVGKIYHMHKLVHCKDQYDQVFTQAYALVRLRSAGDGNAVKFRRVQRPVLEYYAPCQLALFLQKS